MNERIAEREAGIADAMRRMQLAGFSCELSKNNDGTYERVELAYAWPGQSESVLTAGWRIGELEHQSRELSLLWLEARKLADSPA